VYALHLLYLPLIKRLFPNALIVHIIRDGRDVAVSLDRIGWIKPFPWDRKRKILVPALFWNGSPAKAAATAVRWAEITWKFTTKTWSKNARDVGEDRRLHRSRPLTTTAFSRMRQGSMVDPNSSFRGDGQEKESNPVGRWKIVLSADDVTQMEGLIGDRLQQMEYPTAAPPEHKGHSLAQA